MVSTLFEWAKSDLAVTWLEGNGKPSTPDTVKELKFAMLCDMLVYDAMDYHHTYLDGLISEEQFGSVCVGFANLFQQPGFEAFWASWREARLAECPTFIEWMDDLIKNRALSSGSRFV